VNLFWFNVDNSSLKTAAEILTGDPERLVFVVSGGVWNLNFFPIGRYKNREKNYVIRDPMIPILKRHCRYNSNHYDRLPKEEPPDLFS